MENVSKVLLMAGEVLIGIIVVSLLMIMFNSLTSYQQVNTQTQREAQIIQFNNQFEGYNRTKVRGNEIYSLVNKVVDYNKRKSTLGNEDDETGIDFGYQPMSLTIKFGSNDTIAEGNRKKLSRGENNVLFEYNTYIFNQKTNINKTISFDTYVKSLFEKNLPESNEKNSPAREKSNTKGKDFKYLEVKLNSLLDSYDSIFNYDDSFFNTTYGEDSDEKKEKIKVFENFNNAFGEEYFLLYNYNRSARLTEVQLNALYNGWLKKDIPNGIWKNLNIYHEYAQFKKAIFKCVARDASGNEISGVEYDQNTGRIIGMTFEFTGKFD